MKKLIVLSALAMGAFQATAQTKDAAINWKVDVSHSNVKFTVDHLVVSEMEGYFKIFNGTIDATSPDFTNAKINFTVDVSSINTDNADRDKHLKSDDFFNAEKYPAMSFASTSFKKIKGNAYVLEGNLTIRDVTKKVQFAVVYGGTIKDPWGNTKAGFRASSKINRKDFGLKWNTLTEAGGAVVGEEVQIKLNIEAGQVKA